MIVRFENKLEIVICLRLPAEKILYALWNPKNHI